MKNLNGLRNQPMKTIHSMIRSFFICAAVACCLLGFADSATALSFTVNDFSSDLGDIGPLGNGICLTSGGTCTLRAALQEVNWGSDGSNTIQFDLGAGTHILLLTSDLPQMSRSVNILGPGSDYAIINGQGLYRIFNLQGAATACAVEKLTLRNSSGTIGPAIFASVGVTVSISRVVFEGNQASGNGGAVSCRGCTASINRCRFSENHASERGGAIEVVSDGYLSNMHDVIFEGNTAALSHGAIYSEGADMDMRNVIFTANSAQTSGALGAHVSGGHFIFVSDATFSGNSAEGLVGRGGAVFLNGSDGRAVFDGVTFSGNRGQNGGAIWAEIPPATTIANSAISGNDARHQGGGIYSAATGIRLDNVTVTGNTAGSADSCSPSCGGGLYGNLSARNSIISGNQDIGQQATLSPDCSSITSGGYNLIGNNSNCTVGGGSGDQIGTALSPIDPLLGSLTRNGGITLTYELLSGSSAIDGGNPGGCYWDHDADRGAASPELLLDMDQRTVSRPSNGVCDIGSYERTNCDDGVQNNGETGVDCGGGGCAACLCTSVGFAATNGNTYAYVQEAYDDTWDGAEILTRKEETGEALVFSRQAYITLIGGHDCDFFRIKGMTTVAGLTVAAGRLTVENIAIGP